MDGRWLAGRILGDVRKSRNLSQRALARIAGVPQPTIAEIERGKREPSLTLLSKLAEATGQTLDVRLVAIERHSAVGTSQRLSMILNGKGDLTSASPKQEDAALRAVLDLRSALRVAEAHELERLITSPPSLTRARGWDAFVAAIVEDECDRRNLEVPRWTQDDRRFIDPPWYLSSNEELHHWELQTAPTALLRHGVLAAADELESV
jgi:transcriptional regulator with XRE-family HTH domain